MLSNGRTMYFKALLDVSVDLEKIWHSISKYNRVNLGGEDGKYTIYFTGSIEDGMEVLKEIINAGSSNIQVSIGY